MYRKFEFIAIPLLMLMAACVKPYYPEIDKYDKILVIDGMLTDDGDAPAVTITYSYQVESKRPEMVRNAKVYINSSDGARYDLDEKSPGEYRYTGSMFKVEHGMSYQLIVEHDGNTFSSPYEKVIPVAAISDLSMQVVTEPSNQGASIFISTKGTDQESKYYSWSYEETWKFRVPLITPQFDDRRICYASSSSVGINIGTTDIYTDNSFSNFPILFITSQGPKLSIRYSILVKQYSISRDTYMYLDHVKKTNESNGSLFDPIPSSMNGNITCETTPVIGNFQVSSVSERRMFIDRQELIGINVEQGMKECRQQDILPGDKHKIDSLESIGYVLMDISTINQSTYYRYASSELCFNCTAAGAVNTPPSWWVEKQ